jgi:hypothetical protein
MKFLTIQMNLLARHLIIVHFSSPLSNASVSSFLLDSKRRFVIASSAKRSLKLDMRVSASNIPWSPSGFVLSFSFSLFPFFSFSSHHNDSCTVFKSSYYAHPWTFPVCVVFRDFFVPRHRLVVCALPPIEPHVMILSAPVVWACNKRRYCWF